VGDPDRRCTDRASQPRASGRTVRSDRELPRKQAAAGHQAVERRRAINILIRDPDPPRWDEQRKE